MNLEWKSLTHSSLLPSPPPSEVVTQPPTFSVFFCTLLLTVTSAENMSCSQACEEALSDLSFKGTDLTADYYIAQCANTLRVQSIFVCIRHYCSPRSIEAGLKDFNNTCQEYGGLSLPPHSIIDDFTKGDTRGWQPISTVCVSVPSISAIPLLIMLYSSTTRVLKRFKKLSLCHQSCTTSHTTHSMSGIIQRSHVLTTATRFLVSGPLCSSQA